MDWLENAIGLTCKDCNFTATEASLHASLVRIFAEICININFWVEDPSSPPDIINGLFDSKRSLIRLLNVARDTERGGREKALRNALRSVDLVKIVLSIQTSELRTHATSGGGRTASTTTMDRNLARWYFIDILTQLGCEAEKVKQLQALDVSTKRGDGRGSMYS